MKRFPPSALIMLGQYVSILFFLVKFNCILTSFSLQECGTVISFYFVGTKFRGLTTMDMFVEI